MKLAFIDLGGCEFVGNMHRNDVTRYIIGGEKDCTWVLSINVNGRRNS
jgi:hypothetical protein